MPRHKPFLLRGVIKEFKDRVVLWPSDWVDGFEVKTLSAAIFIFLSSIFPALAFGTYLNSSTKGILGISEVVLSTGLCGVIFSIFGGQPLIIVGVTGPITIFTSTLYDICQRLEIPFVGFCGWVGIWASIFHFVIAITNASNLVKYVTRFSCEIFGLLVGLLFFDSAIKELIKIWKEYEIASSILSLLISLVTFYCMSTLHHARQWNIFVSWIRAILADYGAVLTVIIFCLVPLLPIWNTVPLAMLPVPDGVFTTTSGRSWWIGEDMAYLPLGYCFAAAIPALVLTILVYFDHNVSSVLSQRKEFGLKKPPAFNYDFIVIGLCMAVCAVLGIPWAHGLIPQSPLHVRSLAVIKHKQIPGTHKTKEYYKRVIETRLANLVQSGLTVACCAVLKFLGFIPTGVMIGFFLYLGYSSFLSNQLAERIKLLFTERANRTPSIFSRVSTWLIFWFTLIQVVFLGIIFGITFTPAAISFPVFILILLPVRTFLLTKCFDNQSLERLDSDGPSDEPLETDGIDGNHTQENHEMQNGNSQSTSDIDDV